jgi:hypothetical protein
MSQDQVISNAQKPEQANNENYSRPPAYGIMQINDKPATSIHYERVENNGQKQFNVDFRLDDKSVAHLKALDAEGLADATGDKNAAFIVASKESRGTLQGESLLNEYGLSPEENHRRMMLKEERKGTVIDPKALQAATTNRRGETGAAAEELAERRQQALNAISKDTRKQEQGAEQGRDGGDNEVQSDEVFSSAEEDRRPLVPPEVAAKYIKVGESYHFQRNPEAVAFRDRGSKLETQTNSPAVAESMVRIALARGWDEIRVTGSETFKREVWMEAAARGMHVRGYSPTDVDKARIAALKTKSEFRGRETASTAEGKKTREQDMAETFKKESPEKAMQKFPELAGAYAGIEAARRHVEQERLSGEQAKVVMARINKNAANAIERGHIPMIQVNEREQDRDRQKDAAASSHRENELGR